MFGIETTLEAMGPYGQNTDLLELPSKGAMMEIHWEVLLTYETQIKALCSRMARGRDSSPDDLWGECIDRVEGICNTYDPHHVSGASLKHHVLRNLGWYCSKLVNKSGSLHRDRRHVTIPEGYDKEEDLPTTQHAGDWVKTILSHLDEYDRTVLEMRHLHSMTYDEMADMLGVGAKTTARNHYLAALAKARKVSTSVLR